MLIGYIYETEDSSHFASLLGVGPLSWHMSCYMSVLCSHLFMLCWVDEKIILMLSALLFGMFGFFCLFQGAVRKLVLDTIC